MRLNQGEPTREQTVSFWNNVWSDHTADGGGLRGGNDFSDAPRPRARRALIGPLWNGGRTYRTATS